MYNINNVENNIDFANKELCKFLSTLKQSGFKIINYIQIIITLIKIV